MANPFFQFKEFTVYQERCSLKVSTDSCLFGAWLANKLSAAGWNPRHTLDIGSGSGLLMLMLAQKLPGRFLGIEIDPGAYEQSAENLRSSPWYDRLEVFHQDIKLFEHPHQYDLIVSNPPFYEGDLKSTNSQKNLAKHDLGLTLSDLVETVDRNLVEDGLLALLLPSQRVEYFAGQAAAAGLYVWEELRIRQRPAQPFIRSCLLLGRNNRGIIFREDLDIEETPGTYSEKFKALLGGYYLYL